MQRFRQILFAVSLPAVCWLLMLAVHEFGHVVGAVVTGGTVERVVLSPLAISRTDVSPNPHPAEVVWLGPIVGCLLPLAAFLVVARRDTAWRGVAMFFAGFCLIANGAYISFGSFDRIGDCGEMHRTGTPLWAMVAFGAIAMSLGLFVWHRLGSLAHFIRHPEIVTSRMAYLTFGFLLAVVIAEFVLIPR